MGDEALGASFRDPSGFVFRRDGCIYRQVNACFADDYELLHSSGLYQKLVNAELLIPHEEVEQPACAREVDSASVVRPYKILRPEQLDFVSYPYEWSFSQLKDAALLTLRVQRLALAACMTLKTGVAPTQNHDVIQAAAAEFGLDADVLKRVLALKHESPRAAPEDLKLLYGGFMTAVEKLAREIDQMDVTG